LRKDLAAAGGKTGADGKGERELRARLDAHRESVLRLGPVGRLLMNGVLDDLQPVDNSGPLAATLARQGDITAKKSREVAITRNALRGGEAVMVVVLDGRFDLTESVQEQHANCGYVRVTTRAVAELREKAR
jgi:hypothetical protein